MIENITAWLQSCWQWCVDNKDAILGFLTSAQFVAIVGVVVKVVFQGRQLKLNNTLTGELNGSLANNNEKFETLAAVNQQVAVLEQENAELRKMVAELTKTTQDNDALTNGKLNTMLEVQQMVYSTIRDDDTRRAVSNLLTRARYDDIDLKNHIEEEMEALKKTVDEQIKTVGDNVNAQMDSLEKAVNVAKIPKKKAEKQSTTIRG